MLPTVCLVVLLAAYVGAQVVRRTVGALELDVWATLVYLGLAEVEAPPVRRRARRRR